MQWEACLPVFALAYHLLILPIAGHITYIEVKYPLQVSMINGIFR
jgi:hypothetical protein